MQTIDLSLEEIATLTIFLQRLTFNQLLACTDRNSEDQAYEMQAATGKLRKQLSECYFFPSSENIKLAIDAQ